MKTRSQNAGSAVFRGLGTIIARGLTAALPLATTVFLAFRVHWWLSSFAGSHDWPVGLQWVISVVLSAVLVVATVFVTVAAISLLYRRGDQFVLGWERNRLRMLAFAIARFGSGSPAYPYLFHGLEMNSLEKELDTRRNLEILRSRLEIRADLNKRASQCETSLASHS